MFLSKRLRNVDEQAIPASSGTLSCSFSAGAALLSRIRAKNTERRCLMFIWSESTGAQGGVNYVARSAIIIEFPQST
jgi:hypothetical protein